MTTTALGNLSYGLNTTLPDGITAKWGARLIAPADLLWDRQELKSTDEDAKQALVAWLNGDPAGTGAIQKLLDMLNELGYSRPRGLEFVAVEDERGMVLANDRDSGGYVYVVAFLKP